MPKKIYAASTIDQLMATATNLSLSFLCSLREYHKYRTTTLHEVLPTVHERNNPYDQYAVTTRKKYARFYCRADGWPPSKRDVKGCTIDAE